MESGSFDCRTASFAVFAKDAVFIFVALISLLIVRAEISKESIMHSGLLQLDPIEITSGISASVRV